MAKILVTDGEQRSALAIVRSLGRAGHEVHVCSSHAHALAAASRFCRASYRVADASTSHERFRDDVRSIVSRGYDVLLPATDASTLSLLELRRTEPGLKLALPDEAAYLGASDKAELVHVARKLGVAVPSTEVLERSTSDRAAAWELARRNGFDVVVKPARSAVLARGKLLRFSVRLVRSEADLRSVLSAMPEEAYPLLVQGRISGPGVGVFMLAREGSVAASFAHVRLREKPPTGGVSVYRESAPLREDARRAAEAILSHYAWTGVAMVEFKEDKASRVPYLMEVNGRFWGSLQLAIDAGVDFPALLVRVLLGERVEPVESYRLGIRSRWLWGDVDHLLWVLRRGAAHRNAFPEIPSATRAIARFLVPWRPGDRFEVLRASDPGPFLRESIDWIGRALRRGGR